MDNIKKWTVLYVEESVRMTEGRDKWRKYVHGVADRRIEEHNIDVTLTTLVAYTGRLCRSGERICDGWRSTGRVV